MDKKIFEGFIDDYHRSIYSSENGYYMLTFVPNNARETLLAAKKIDEFNANHSNKKADFVEFESATKGLKEVYVKTPMSVLEVGMYMFTNRKKNWLDERNVMRISGKSYEQIVAEREQKAALNKRKRTNALVTGGAAVLLAAALGGVALNMRVSGNNPSQTPTETTNAGYYQEYTQENISENQEPETNKIQETQQASGMVIDYDSIDINNLDCKTYQTSSGQEMYELADCLFISDVCYNKLVKALNEYNNRVPEGKRYDFDASKFNSAMFTGEQIRESSLCKTNKDINDACRGPFKIGAAAIEEANQVSRNLFGYNIIDSEEDLYDPAKSCMACMCIAVKNYEYCSGVIDKNNVTANMVFDCYLWGCGNIRRELRENSYAPKAYSERIVNYGEVLDEYYKQIMNEQTDGSHDEFWRACYSKLNSVSENTQQRGE